jgi:hypothetical protein
VPPLHRDWSLGRRRYIEIGLLGRRRYIEIGRWGAEEEAHIVPGTVSSRCRVVSDALSSLCGQAADGVERRIVCMGQRTILPRASNRIAFSFEFFISFSLVPVAIN